MLTDHVAGRELIGAKGVPPVAPDDLPDPKQPLLRLAKGAPKHVRDDLLQTIHGNLSPGLGYNARLSEWVNSVWNPQRAAARSPSLAPTQLRLNQVVDAFVLPVPD